MDEDLRTIWCGNLSEKVTEEILYELFLQGGPVQRVSIPRDHDGKQRTYGFVTYKHINSVKYALNLFDGTMLFNRPLNMSPRKTVQKVERTIDFNYALQLGQQILLSSVMSHLRRDPFEEDMLPSTNSHMKQTLSYKDDRRSRRTHPYHKEQNKSNNYHKDQRPRDSHNNHKTNYYSRRDYKSSNRHNYR
ncbi:RNA-binding protein 7 [Anthophora retusa]